ncbi:MAG: hypothetical protein HC906_16260 [Bacteroidales bacterium]|nr:hypothetical protein [Bacteroidales bacterium]
MKTELQKQLLKEMGYTEEVVKLCKNCTHYAPEPAIEWYNPLCVFNAITKIKINENRGRCNHFTAKS